MILALVGNQNAGKTTLFNQLTGARQHVGNFPGVTVEKKAGALRGHENVTVVDLPGTYSLSAYTAEEAVTLRFLTEENPDGIINIVDATNLERNLYLTLQLLEYEIPVVVALNMMDELQANGTYIDTEKLSDRLGVPVLPMSAVHNKGVDALAACAVRMAKECACPHSEVRKKDAEQRYLFLDALCSTAVTKQHAHTKAQTRSAKIDAVLLHKYFSIPIFFCILFLVFYITFGPIGSALSDLMTSSMDTAIAALRTILVQSDVSTWLTALIADGACAGVSSVLSFLPTILILFFLLSVLEDTGYMARVAFIMDALLRKIGLSGRAFVPLLLGFGCSVPAVMATRTLASAQERKRTVMLVPFMSCSAKMPIYAVFSTAFFPQHGAFVMLALYGLGILMGIGSALLLKDTVFIEKDTAFFIELPPYRLPTAKSVILHMWEKAKDFVIRAFTVIFCASLLLWMLQSFDFKFNMVTDGADSILAQIGKWVAPLFKPLGFGRWEAVAALVTGLTAKEAVVSTFAVVCGVSPANLSLALSEMFTPLQAVSFLVFTLLYMPCVAAMAAVRRELGSMKHAVLAMAYQTAFAWLVAFLVYSFGLLFV